MLSDAEKQRCIDLFKTEAPLARAFPISLPNGAVVGALHGRCNACKQIIDPAQVRGRVAWPIPTVVVVDGAGYCESCQSMTQLYLRVRGVDGGRYRVEAIGPRGWVAVTSPMSWERRFRLWVQSWIRSSD